MLSYTLCNWNCMPVFCIMFTARLKDTWDQSKLELYCWHSVIITIIVISITVFVIIVIIIVIITAITIVIIFTTIPARSLHDKITLSLHIGLSSYYHMLSSLVGGIPTPLKNMKVNWDDYAQYMEILWNNIWSVVWNFISQYIGIILFQTTRYYTKLPISAQVSSCRSESPW